MIKRIALHLLFFLGGGGTTLNGRQADDSLGSGLPSSTVSFRIQSNLILVCQGRTSMAALHDMLVERAPICPVRILPQVTSVVISFYTQHVRPY